jgi:hypothetical protein
MSAPNERSSGKFVRVGKPVPTTDVDCSSWERSAGPRSRGTLIGVAEHVPPVSGEFAPTPPAWLELAVAFDEQTPTTKAIDHALRLVEVARAGDPGLGLTYDPARSRAGNDDVVIALAPRNQAGAVERLARVAEVIQSETAQFQGIRRLVATVAHAA